MSTKHYGPMYEKESKKQRKLQQEVLEHLKAYGPRDGDTLYIHFVPRSIADIAPVLENLKESKSIEVGKDRMVTSTAFGLKRLEEKKY